MLSYNDRASESSESDLDDDHIYKATTSYGKIVKEPPRRHYSSSEEEEDSEEEGSLSEQPEEEAPPYPSGDKITRKAIDKIAPIYQRGSDSQDSEQENSIDHIEERIKRLEMDLEKKIDKHKKESSAVVKDRPQTAVDIKGKNLKSAGSPPLPKKMEAKSGIISKMHPSAKPHKAVPEEIELQGKVEAEEYLPPTKKDPRPIEQLIEEQREAKEPSPKKKLSKEKREEQGRNPSLVIDKKRTESKNLAKAEQPHHPYPSHAAQSGEASMVKKLSKATKQIDELAKALEQSKKENKRLRQQLSNSKKKKPLQQVEKLKELIADSQDVKLQKEIQLLKIIEGLQAKLKKSINKKLGKSRAGSTSAALLHKGLPSSLMH